MNRLEKIRAKRQSLDAQAVKEQNERDNRVRYYTNEIKAIAPRLRKMFEVADEMVKNCLHFGPTYKTMCGFTRDDFETDGIRHGIGFVFEYHKRGWGAADYRNRIRVIGIGIEGGGCCGNSIVVNRDGEIIVNPIEHIVGTWTYNDAYGDFCGKCSRFLAGFDVFERSFYDYIDNLV